MLKREIKYKTFDGVETTEIFYFNLTKTEMIEMEVETKDGLDAKVRRIIAADDKQQLIAEFKAIILAAYGVKSDDGKRFVKSDQLREEFSQHAAFDALFIELATNDKAASDFITGVIPDDMNGDLTAKLPPPNIQPAENIER